MSGVPEQRAAVFSSRPQAVEIFQSGAWWPGELLGWRHDESGGCQVQVRVVLGGRAETAWMELTSLRLPERRLSVAGGPSLPADAERGPSRGGAVLRDVSAPADLSATVSLPMIRERSPNHPAGGRRRAPETGAMPVISSGDTQAEAAAPTVRGRHRAPADPGRHRRADTGFLAVVPGDEPPAPARPSAHRAAQTEAIPALRRREAWTTLDHDEPELLTRPMRLSDLSATSRRARVNGSLAGA